MVDPATVVNVIRTAQEVFDLLKDITSAPTGVITIRNQTEFKLTMSRPPSFEDGEVAAKARPPQVLQPLEEDSFGIVGESMTRGAKGTFFWVLSDENGVRQADWTTSFDLPAVDALGLGGDNTATEDMDPQTHPRIIRIPPTVPASGTDEVPFVFMLDRVGFLPKPNGGGGGTATDVPTSCVITVKNETQQQITLHEEGHSRGGFTATVPPHIDPGEEIQISSVETPGATEEGTTGFLTYDLGGGNFWRIDWDNPEKAQNTAHSQVTGPAMATFHGLAQPGQGEENVPVTFTLSGGGAGPGPQPGGTATKTIVQIVNATQQELTVLAASAMRGQFTGIDNGSKVPAGGTVEGEATETPGASGADQQGNAGFATIQIGEPDHGFWQIQWNNPEGGTNSASSDITGEPDGSTLTKQEVISDGDTDVRAVFTIMGGGGGTTPPPEQAEWAPPDEASEPTLRRGADSADGWVEYLQELLNRAGESLTVDGDFGPGTEAAVRRYQQRFDIQVDGIVGFQTWASLRGDRNVPASTDGKPAGQVEGGPEARWVEEDFNAVRYDVATDSLVLSLYSVGTEPVTGAIAHVRLTGNDSGELFVTEEPVGPPHGASNHGGALHAVTVAAIKSRIGVGKHTVEAYLPAELGGDYVTAQFEVQ